MNREEIIKREVFNIISELKANRALHGYMADQSLADIARELEETAKQQATMYPDEVMMRIRKDYFEAVSAEALLSPGIATVIEDSKDRIYLARYEGNIGDDTGTLVSKETRFDYASITKLFTVLEALKLNQDGLFDIHQIISEIANSPFNMLHVTVWGYPC